jgi:hypothetical protein
VPSNALPAAAIALFAAGLAFVFWYQRQHPRVITATGEMRVRGLRGDGSAVLRTRDVSVNGVVFKEIEMPNGTWIDCAGDCARAAREAGDGFWQKQMDTKR